MHFETLLAISMLLFTIASKHYTLKAEKCVGPDRVYLHSVFPIEGTLWANATAGHWDKGLRGRGYSTTKPSGTRRRAGHSKTSEPKRLFLDEYIFEHFIKVSVSEQA